MPSKIGFLINPIAGMGGKVGLKGTDGVVKKAVELGAKPTAPSRALETINNFLSHYPAEQDINWYTCSQDMGADVLRKAGIKKVNIIYQTANKDTTSSDTIKACKRFLDEKIDLILFCGGDGTARDIFEVIGDRIPILGIPSGVKMHSGVFGVNTDACAKMLAGFINNDLTIGDVDIMDLDEEKYREEEWEIRLFGIAKGIVEPTYVQVGKMTFESVSDNIIKDELTEHIEDEMKEKPGYLFLFGSGSTINYIANKLHIDNTLLGIDSVYNFKNIGKDLNEEGILNLLKKHSKVKIILSPIGAQGFILGRGNLQLSPAVIKKIGLDNIIVISTPSKIVSTPVIRVDTGDKKLDQEFMENEYIMVVVGYRLSRVVKLQSLSNFDG